MSDVLTELLNRTALELRSIAVRLGLLSRTTTTKRQWAAAIARFWLHDARRQEVLAQLSPQARLALQRLLQFHSIPRPLFCAEFGDLRAARSAYPRNSLPWRTPHSAAEELAYAGLLHGADNRPLHKTAAFLLPPQLYPLLLDWLTDEPLKRAAPPDERFPISTFTACALAHDVAELLALLHRCRQQELALRHGRWLPAAALRRLNDNLLHPDPLPLPRSHKGTQRLRYLGFWAAAAGLHDGGWLTPAGWDWLDLPLGRQVECLWQGWRSAPGLLRAAWDWPDALLPAPWPELLWQVLRRRQDAWLPAEIAADLLALADTPAAYWVANLEDTHTLEEIVAELCHGPLAHFGLVAGEADAAQRLRFQLTGLGRKLLNDLAPTVSPQEQAAPCTWRQEDEALIIERPAAVLTHGVVILAVCAQQESFHHSQDAATHVYQLTASSLRWAVQKGMTTPLLLDALETLAISLPHEQTKRLLAWLRPPAHIDVDLVTLLRTAASQTMAALYDDPAIAGHLQALIRPTAAILDLTPDAARALLQQRGFAPPPPALQPVGRPAGREAELAAGWLAGQLYALLRQFLPLPLDPPYALLDEAYAALPSAQQALLTAWRERLAQDLLDLLDGRTFTPPPHPSDPAQWRPLLQPAMENGQWLEMLYFSPARNLLICRHIQPAWFSRRRGVEYLLADCQEAGSVLTFRLDRIHSLQPMTLPDAAHPTPPA